MYQSIGYLQLYMMKQSVVNLCLLLILAFMNAACLRKQENAMKIQWENSILLPGCKDMQKNAGLAGAYSGIVGRKLLVLGGANFPQKYPWEGGTKIWWSTLYSYGLDNREWKVYDDFLPLPLAYGVSIQVPEGLLCVGGCNQAQCSDKVFLIKEENHSLIIDSISYPSLPVPLANAAGALLDGKVYIAGGQESMKDEKSTGHFYMLDLHQKEMRWQKMSDWPGSSRGYAVCAAQGGKIYLFGGRSYGPDEEMRVHTDGYAFEPDAQQWEKILGNFPVMAGTAISYEKDKILFLGGVEKILPASPEHPGFSHKVRVFQTKAKTMLTTFNSPYPIPVTTNVVCDTNAFYITSGEVQPGIRTPHILKSTIHDR